MSLPTEDCCRSTRLKEEEAVLLEKPAEVLEELAQTAVLFIYDCCIGAYSSYLELINADIR